MGVKVGWGGGLKHTIAPESKMGGGGGGRYIEMGGEGGKERK